MTDGKDPVHQLIDVMIYAPIGLLAVAQRELPELVATGKKRLDDQLALARFIGKMAVSKGRRELGRRLHATTDSELVEIAAVPIQPSTSTSGLLSPSAAASMSLPAVIIAAVAQSPLLREPDELPIEGYDSLAASQVVLRLGSLTPAELEAVRRYEHGHRARRTILGKINQLQAI